MKIKDFFDIDAYTGIILLILGSLFFPLFFVSPYSDYKIELQCITLPVLSSLCLSIILFKYKILYSFSLKNKVLSLSSITIIFISVFHFFRYSTYTYGEFCFSVLWVTIPFCFFLYSCKIEKIFPFYCFLLWIIDLFYSHIQTDQIVGIAGNRNWHATSLIMFIAFGSYFLIYFYLYLKKKTNAISFIGFLIIIIINLSLIIYSLYIYKLCRCRAADISVIFTIALFLYLLTREYKPILAKAFAIMLILSCIASTIIYSYVETSTNENNSKIQTVCDYISGRITWNMQNDVRLPLWQGCLNLAEKHLFTGIGIARFESEFESFRPLSYFLMPDNAVRSNHPHNSVLYILTGYGIFGLIAWSLLWIYPMIYCLINFTSLSAYYRTVLFVYICMFLHSLLDLIFFEWPTLYFSAILIGFLWYKTWSISGQEHQAASSKLIKTISIITACVILIMSFMTAFQELMSSYYTRQATILYDSPNRNPAEELTLYEKGFQYKKEPKYLYRAATTSLYDLNNPELALKYLQKFNDISTGEYAHKNGFISLAYIRLGKYKEALPFLIRETVNYPLLTASWHRLALIQKKLGMNAQANVSIQNMYQTMKLKGLPDKALPLLLQHPDYDSHPNKIPQSDLDTIK